MPPRSTDEKHEPLPYYRWYWKDWRANRRVQKLSWVQRGAYRELLDECWAEGSIPDDPHKLADIVGCSAAEMREMWPALKSFFVEIAGIPGRLANHRLDRERTHADSVRIVRQMAGREGNRVSRGKSPAQGDLLPNAGQMPIEEQSSSKSRVKSSSKSISDSGVAATVAAWNGMAQSIGAATVIAVKGRRLTSLEARLAEPGWRELSIRAIAFLGSDTWFRANPDAVRFDALVRPGKVEEYVERSTVARTGTPSRGGARADVDRGIHDSLAAGAGRVKGDASDD